MQTCEINGFGILSRFPHSFLPLSPLLINSPLYSPQQHSNRLTGFPVRQHAAKTQFFPRFTLAPHENLSAILVPVSTPSIQNSSLYFPIRQP
jgi:hypothetical protein